MGGLPRSLAAAIVALGFTALLGQVVLARELLSVFLGNELTIGLVLAVWLVLVAAGSGLLGRLLARLTPTPAAYAVLQLLLVALLPAQIALARRLGFQSVLPGEIPPPPLLVWGAVEVLALPCLIIGAQFVLACRLAARDEATGAISGVARVYLLEAVGTVAGGLFFHWVAADYLSAFQVMALLAAVNGLAAGWVLWAAGRRAWAPAAAGLALAWGGALLLNAPRWEIASLRARPHWGELGLVSVENSRFGRIAVTRRMGQTAIFQNGVLLFTSEDEQANEAVVHLSLLQHPRPRRVLLLGGGVSGAVGEILKHPVERVDYVELDPQIIEVAERALPRALWAPLADPRVHTHLGDARVFLRSAPARYDAIIANLPDPTTALLNRFYTAEFFGEARRAAAPGGILSVGISSSETFIGEELRGLNASVLGALRRTFASVALVPGETMFLIASVRRGGVTQDADLLAGRLKERGLRNRYVTPFWIDQRVEPFRVEMIRQALGGGEPAAINRDFRPVSYYYQTQLWLRRMAPSLGGPLRALSRVRLWWFAATLAGAGLAAAVWGRRRRYRAPALALALMAMGAAAMALEIAALLAFQVARGYVYHQLGVLIAAFMAGLAVGVFWAERRLGRAPGDAGRVCLGAMVLLAAVAAAFWAMAGAITRHPWLASWGLGAVLFVAGAAVAAAFPAAAGLYAGPSRRVVASAAALYAADLVGAAGGALLASLVLIPVLGVTATVIATGLLAATGAVLAAPLVRAG